MTVEEMVNLLIERVLPWYGCVFANLESDESTSCVEFTDRLGNCFVWCIDMLNCNSSSHVETLIEIRDGNEVTYRSRCILDLLQGKTRNDEGVRA